jgi:hypothetical protein
VYCEKLCMFAVYKFFILCAHHPETKTRKCVAQNPRTAKTSAQSSMNKKVFLINGSFYVLIISSTQGVSKILGYFSGVISALKKIYVNSCQRTFSFRGTPPSSIRFSRFDCYMWKHLRNPSVFLSNWKLIYALPTKF